MKKLVITIDITENGEIIINSEQKNLTGLEILGLIEQMKYVMLQQPKKENSIPSLSDIIEKEKEDNIIPLKP